MSARLSFIEWAKTKGVDNIETVEQSKFGKLNSEYIDYAAQCIADQAVKEYQKDEESASKMQQQIEKLNNTIKEQGVEMQKMKDAQTSSPKSKEDVNKKFREDVVEAARKVMKSMLSKGEYVTKADTTTASVANNGMALDLPDVGQLATTRTTFLDFLMANNRMLTVPMNANGTVRYIDWDPATIARAADMVAEGGTFPESEAAWQTYTTTLKKVGDSLPWTDEFEYDDNFLITEIQEFLRINVRLVKGNQVINGDGTGQNLTGIVNLAPAYVPAASGITDASVYDLVVKLREGVQKDRGSKYNVNFGLMNITDINKYKLKKDADNNYIMPPFYDREGNRIDGVTILEDNNVVENTMVVGDVRYVRVYQQPGIGIETGYINTDFTDGKKRMRLYERCLFLIRTVDRTGFLKVTDIDAALTTLATAIP